MIKIYKTDKVDTTEIRCRKADTLVLDNTGVGVITLRSPTDFIIQCLSIGPHAQAFTIKYEVVLLPAAGAISEVLGIAKELVTWNSPTEMYYYFPQNTKYFRKELRITVTNTSGSLATYYFNCVAFDGASIPTTKF